MITRLIFESLISKISSKYFVVYNILKIEEENMYLIIYIYVTIFNRN